ncbi:MAG: hypothetical protein GY862_37145 [Gammaproteobacteria bacterium]|nr:hypothetical protein [Gammaproteobacteria bacterium]
MLIQCLKKHLKTRLKGSLEALALLLLLAACGKTPVLTKTVEFDVGKKANFNSPVAVDLVAVDDISLLWQISRLSAREWFDRRRQFQHDFPLDLQIWEWELVPGEEIPVFEIPNKGKEAMGLMIFANYAAPGLHRVRIGPFAGVLIRLMENELAVYPLDGQ